jgi:homoserine dehydrogenase
MDEKTVKIGLVGFGTVGTGVVKILQENGQEIAERTGVRLELACVVDKDTTTRRAVSLPEGVLTDDLGRLLNDKSIDVAIELVGGTTFAKELVLKMLSAGKHVVTANKALLAEQGSDLYRAALKAKRCIAFEASCCGGFRLYRPCGRACGEQYYRTIRDFQRDVQLYSDAYDKKRSGVCRCPEICAAEGFCGS